MVEVFPTPEQKQRWGGTGETEPLPLNKTGLPRAGSITTGKLPGSLTLEIIRKRKIFLARDDPVNAYHEITAGILPLRRASRDV
jgi:hypothetical protein